jgi:hypothetical protein
VDVSIETIRKRTSKKELYEFVVHASMNREMPVVERRPFDASYSGE